MLANIKSAKKRIKITRYRTALNRSRKSEIKTYIRQFEEALEAGNTDRAQELIKVIDRKLKRASHKNIIHKNAVARQISKLTKKLNEAM